MEVRLCWCGGTRRVVGQQQEYRQRLMKRQVRLELLE